LALANCNPEIVKGLKIIKLETTKELLKSIVNLTYSVVLPSNILYLISVVAHGSSGGSLGAVVAHWEQWWLIGSDTRLYTAVLGSNPAISPAYSGLPVLRWAAIWDGTLLYAVL
jgi:hypothetical protein